MDGFFSTPTPLVFVAETWVIAVVSIAIFGCFIFLIVLLITATRVKSATPKLYTNVRRRIFYAQPTKRNETTTAVQQVTDTNASTEPLVPPVVNSAIPYQPPVVMMLPPPPPPPLLPPPRPFLYRRPRKIFVPTPVAVPIPTPVRAPLAYYPGKMFASNMPRRFYPYKSFGSD